MEKTSDRACARNGLEWLLNRPVAETELDFVFGNIVDAWPMIMDGLAERNLAYGIVGTGPVLYSEHGQYRGANLFRCLESYLASSRST